MKKKRINTVLTQQSRSKGESRTFEIYNDKFVKVSNQSLFGNRNYHLNLSMLEPWPVHHRRLSRRWLLSLIFFGLATLTLGFYLYVNQDQNTLTLILPFIITFILLTIGSLIFFVYHSPNVTEFRSRYCGCVLLRLFHNKPDSKTFRAFIAELKTRILAASEAITFDKQQMLAIELKELRRLTDEGAVTEEDYERANKRIMNMRF